MSNLKIDIIYYKTSSDFELEFNLSGCCRMRIFKDKIDTQKGLINTLARDVARSKIIIIVTDLFGENSGIPILSKAISLPLHSPNKDEFGIKTEDDIFIPETAVPLVTKTGIFGGCIIESGPQSIIIVSSVRSLRHEIMKAYVHNYVFDVGQLMAYKERMGEGGHNAMPPSISNITTPTEDVILSTTEPILGTGEIINDIVTNEVVEEAENESNNIEIDDSKTEETSIFDDMKVSSENESKKSDFETDFSVEDEIKKINEKTPTPIQDIDHPGVSSFDRFDYDQEEIESHQSHKKRRSGSNLLLLIVIILLLAGLGILAYYLIYQPLRGIESSFGDESFIGNFINSLFS